MPQASDEQRARWGISEDKATKFLTDQGYTLTRGFEWLAPEPTHSPTDLEVDAVQFMIDEWDYGGILLPGPGQDPKRYSAA